VSWLICLTGGIASGKTTLADALRAALPGAVRLSFGDVVRRRAQATCAEPTREHLQETGLQLIREGWVSFVDELLSGLEGDPAVLVVEGVRHREAVDTLRTRQPTRRLLLVYVEIADQHRQVRLARRAEPDHVLTHNVERDVESLRAVADVVVQGHRPVDELVAIVRRHITQQRSTDDLS
jgi:dephospho-CoA kinase